MPNEGLFSVIPEAPHDTSTKGGEYHDARQLLVPATRIRRILHMPVFIGSNYEAGMDCEPFVQSLNIFRYLKGQSHNPVMDQDFLDNALLNDYFRFDSHNGVEATRQAIAIGALKGLQDLARERGKDHIDTNTYESLVKIANKIPLALYNILRLGKTPRSIAIGQAVSDGSIAAYWYTNHALPTLPQTFRALRQQLGMPPLRNDTNRSDIDPSVIVQQLLTVSYYGDKLSLDGFLPTNSNIQVLFNALGEET